MKCIRVFWGVLLSGLLAVPAVAVQDEQDKNPRQQIAELVQAKQFDEAIKLIDEWVAAAPQDLQKINLRQAIAMGLLQANDNSRAVEQIDQLLEQTLNATKKERSIQPVITALNSLTGIYRRANKSNEIVGVIDRVVDWAAEGVDLNSFSSQARELSQLIILKADQLSMSRQADESLALLQAELNRADQWLGNDSAKATVDHWLTVAGSVQRALSGEDGHTLAEKMQALVRQQIENDPKRVDLLSHLINPALSQASGLVSDDPDAAQTVIDSFKKMVQEMVGDDAELPENLKRQMASFTNLENRIESARKMLRMIGQPAPDMDADFWVNATGMNPDGLKGKVILLDFWAVWCGPCIATFPHLKHWQEAYGPDGFTVVGVTRKYNYQWNDDTQRATKSEDKVSAEQEAEMLEKFIAHHGLKHPSMVTPDGSEMWSNFGVSGIPHAVVIDRKGRVRMIKVGSGDANARALEAMIKECLAEND